MFNAAATRRTSYALIRTPRTPSILSRTPPPRPFHHITNPQSSNLYKQSRILPPISLFHHIQTRPITYLQRTKLNLRKHSKGLWRKNPILLPLAILTVVGSSLLVAYIVYVELFHNAPQYHKFPPAVAKSLRTAVYYTDVDLQPQQALTAYKEALKTAIGIGMHPYSDEVLGIRIQVATMLEKAGLVKPAIEVLERTRAETLIWVEHGREQLAVRKEEEEKRTEELGETPPGQKLEIENTQFAEMAEETKKRDEYEERQQDKAIKKAVGMSIKLSDLYAGDHIQDPKKAQAAQEAAVELCLKELARRESLGLPVSGKDTDKSPWLNRTEVAVAVLGLGENYLATDKEELAMPLFLRALDLLRAEEGPKPTCRQIMLLVHFSVAMAARAQKPIRGERPEAVRAQAVDAARTWALKALEVAAKIPEGEKERCEDVCVSAMYNLGGLSEQQGKTKEAEKWYKDALALVRKVDMGTDSVEKMIAESVKRVSKK
ncbi:hypothetical protein BDW59DRAFT_145541 [Aspergillus cavernicola]|uniref:TPR domain protein n=1 Tax=Aspergillus cavernicola TaxID=176166 RepID=A0ABR4IFU1_9EURO